MLRLRLLGILVICLGFSALAAQAEELTSASFSVPRTVLSGGGGVDLQSTGVGAEAVTLGQSSPVGRSTSSGFTADIGFIVPLPEPSSTWLLLAFPAFVLLGRRRRWLLGVALACAFSSGAARAVPPDDANLQGLLRDPNNMNLPVVGPVDIEVRIYDAVAGGNQLYQELHQNVPLLNGVFSILIGTGNFQTGSFDPALFSEMNRYLELIIEGETLAPRQPVSSTPYALQASNAVTLEGMSFQDIVDAVGQGPQGKMGVQGDQGPQGKMGTPGDQGAQGKLGNQGPQGKLGNQGPQGKLGNQGPQGKGGPPGNQGPQGKEGPPGNQGVQGKLGNQGPQGKEGPPGAPADFSGCRTAVNVENYSQGQGSSHTVRSNCPSTQPVAVGGGCMGLKSLVVTSFGVEPGFAPSYFECRWDRDGTNINQIQTVTQAVCCP